MYQALEIPAELTDWATKHRSVINHVEAAIRQADAPMSERQMWNLIARTYSNEWAAANDRLQTAEQKALIFKSPDNRPLGAIGQALESDTVNDIKREQLLAQASFTIEDELLRQDEHLQTLLKCAMKTQHMLEDSIRVSREALSLSQSFSGTAPKKAQPKSRPDIPLQKIFGNFTHGFLRRKPAIEAIANKHPLGK